MKEWAIVFFGGFSYGEEGGFLMVFFFRFSPRGVSIEVFGVFSFFLCGV